MANHKLIFFFFLLLISVISWRLYQPGLSGGYLLDDHASLSKLSMINNELSKDNLFDYFAAADTGPLKRPISEFSFLIDSHQWPASAWNFKRTNVLIHCLNVILLFVLLFQIFRNQFSEKRALMTALVASLFWGVNPFHVSTVLYVVQRMSLLPALFSLCGLLLYFNFRLSIHKNGRGKNWLLQLFAYYFFVVLAVLSKENGILLVVFIALFEWLICLKLLALKPLSNKQSQWFIKIPVAGFILALLLQIPSAMNGYDLRVFSMYERILTEFRVIVNYIYHLLVPHFFTVGVFADGFIVSEGWLKPIGTIFSFLFVVLLFGLACVYRNKHPWFAFAVLFYFSGHLLESSFFPLEIYFEHRNYLPSLFVFVPLTLFLFKLIKTSKIYIPILILALGLFSFVGNAKIKVWGNELMLHSMTMEKFPESERVRISHANLYYTRALKYDALQIIEDGFEYSDKLELWLTGSFIRCEIHEFETNHFDALLGQFNKVLLTKDGMKMFGNLIDLMIKDGCGNPEFKKLVPILLSAFLENTKNQNNWASPYYSYYLGSYLVDVKNNASEALSQFEKVFVSPQYFFTGIQAINKMMNQKFFNEAEVLIDVGLKAHKEIFSYRIDWNKYGETLHKLKQTVQIINSSK